MEKEDRRCFVYRHRRLDTNEIFYIGKGTTSKKFLNSESDKKKFVRAFSKRNRNQWWVNISKLGYEIEILKTNLTEDESNDLEELLITTYGRKDCCGGTLVNLTDGGEGAIGRIMSEEQKQEIGKRNSGVNNKWFKIASELHPMYGRIGELNPYFGKTHSEEVRESMKKPHLSARGKGHFRSKVVLHLLTGIFYDCVRDAAEAFGLNYSTLKNNLNGTNRVNKTDFIII